MTDLISRDALRVAVEQFNTPQARLGSVHDLLEKIFEQIAAAPAIIPQIIIDVTGGIADGVAATHKVELNVLDYDITDNEQSDYVIDENGDQTWLYGEHINVDPARVEQILSYPEVGDA